MSDLLTFEKKSIHGTPAYFLTGVINEEANLTFLSDIPSGPVIINTKGVERINSCGVREWITSLKNVPAETSITYVECSPAFLDQVNMISNFIGNGTIKSMFIPFICEACDNKKDILVDLDVCLQEDELELPEEICKSCGEAMELGDDPEQLFSFLE